MKHRELFRLEAVPLFQNKMYETAHEARMCPVSNIVLVQDMTSGLIFNESFEADRLIYDKAYQNEQSCSQVFQHHLDAVTEIVWHRFSGMRLIEIGCGKGFFLEHLMSLGFDIAGIDPAYEGNNTHVIRECFRTSLGLSGDGLILRHVLEHMSQPVEFLREIANANGGKGMIYIEVPCFEWICRNHAWFDIYYEHVNYFRLADFYRIFGTVHESGYLFNGQYLYVIADLSSLRMPLMGNNDRATFPVDFLMSLRRIAESGAKQRRSAVWGAAAKGTMFALHVQRLGLAMDCAIDINPAKQNKYLAGTGLRVISPELARTILEAGDTIYVANSSYYDEIVQMSQGIFSYRKVDEHGF